MGMVQDSEVRERMQRAKLEQLESQLLGSTFAGYTPLLLQVGVYVKFRAFRRGPTP